MVTYRSIYRYVYTFIGIHRYTQTSIHTYISFLCQLRRLKSNNIPTTMGTLSAQIVASNSILQQKELGLLAEMVDTLAMTV